MYSVYADGVCIYNDAFALDNMKLASPKLTLEDNAAGSFVMTVPPSNLGYSTIIRMVTDIAVHKDGKEIWAGRVLSENEDFYRNRVLTCEGELAFFNDSTQPPAEYAGGTIREYLEAMTPFTTQRSETTGSSPSALLRWWMKIFRLITPTMKRPSRS